MDDLGTIGNVTVPTEFLLTYPIFGVFIGDILKKLDLTGWILSVNMISAGILACWIGTWDPITFILGMEIGAASTGIHGLRKQLNLRQGNNTQNISTPQNVNKV